LREIHFLHHESEKLIDRKNMHVYRLLHRIKKGGHIATLGKGTVTRKMTRILSTNRKEIEECLNAFLPDFSATN